MQQLQLQLELSTFLLSKIYKLQRKFKFARFQQRNRFLQIISFFAVNLHLVTFDWGLNLDFWVFDFSFWFTSPPFSSTFSFLDWSLNISSSFFVKTKWTFFFYILWFPYFCLYCSYAWIILFRSFISSVFFYSIISLGVCFY